MPKESFSAEELALVGAVHDDPRNDGPRLTYADWLENHGAGDYAEFIRLQCEQPYVANCTRDKPDASTSHEFPWEDEAAKQRLKRLLSLYPVILPSERFAPYRQDYYYQEFVRGLALWEVDDIPGSRWEESSHHQSSPTCQITPLSSDPAMRSRVLAKSPDHAAR